MPAETTTQPVRIPEGDFLLHGDLRVPAGAPGLVIFAHGSGSSRFSTRNRSVADALERDGLATLLLDLLTPAEESLDVRTAEFRFDIPRLARRVVAATDWAARQPDLRALRVGYFGASTGAAAALVAAAERPSVAAVVSRGGRPDLAERALPRVQAPTLLIVGGNDAPVIEMNEEAMRRMRSEVKLEIVPGATHLFEEPGALEQVSRLAAAWFRTHLGPRTAPGEAEIPRERWREALEEFSREHRAWLGHLERGGEPPATGPDRPFAAVTPEVSGSRVVAIRIDFAGEHGDARVRIEEPVRIAIERTADGAASGLCVEGAGGRETRLRFRVPPPAAMLDGVAPAED